MIDLIKMLQSRNSIHLAIFNDTDKQEKNRKVETKNNVC